MIYLEPASLGWQPILKSWINTLPDALTKEHDKLITALFQWALPVSISFVRRQCKVNVLLCARLYLLNVCEKRYLNVFSAVNVWCMHPFLPVHIFFVIFCSLTGTSVFARQQPRPVTHEPGGNPNERYS